MSIDNSESDKAAARHLCESSYRLLDAERLADAIRFAAGEYNDAAIPVVAVVRQMANRLREADKQPNSVLDRKRPFQD